MKKTLLFTLLCISVLSQAWSQKSSFEVSGIVSDPDETTLVGATIVLLNAADSTLSNFAVTNPEGEFKLEGIKPGNYIIQVTYLGFEQLEQTLEINPTIGDVNMGKLNLQLNTNVMDEVVIESEHTPMMMKKDTLIYNAGAFQAQPNEVVEDLLRKMPGIEVEDDGTVIAQGEEVKQILVDGKKFFSSDPTIATRNLPADAVKQVEVYDKQSDMAEFSGVDDGNREKTMNLELKEDKKNGYFGNITAGYGSDERYTGSLSLNRFNPRLQMSLISNVNNVNQQGFSVSQYQSFMGGFGGGGGGGRGGSGGGIPINRGLSQGFVDTEAVGFNMNYQLGSKTTLNANYFLNFIGNNISSTSIRENFLKQGSYFSTDITTQLSDNKNHRVFVELNHEIDSTQDIRIRSNLGFNDASLLSTANNTIIGFTGDTENINNQAYDNGGDNINLQGSAIYRKKFGREKNQVFTLNASLNDIDDDIIADLESEAIFNPDNVDTRFVENIVQNQIQTSDQLNYTIESSFVQPVGFGKFLEFNFEHRNFDDDLVKDVYDILNQDQSYNLELSNHYLRNYMMDRAGISYHINTDKSNFTTELNLQRSSLEGDMVLENSVLKKSYLYFVPRMNWRYDLGRSNNLQIRYSTNIREPSMDQLQPIVDNSNPLNIYIGNPELKPEYGHNLRVRYFKYDQFSFRSFFATITANYSTNSIVNEKRIDENFVQVTTPRNVDRDYRISGNISYGTPLKFLKTRINLSSNLSYSNNILFVNTTENNTNRYSSSLQVRLENRFKRIVDVAIGTRLSYNLTNYSVNSELNQDYINQRYFTDLTFNVINKWAISTSMHYNIYDQQTLDEKQKIPIWNASISRYIMKDQKGEFKLTAFDLLNQNLGINQTSNLNYTEYEEVLSLGRYVMLSFTYALRGMGQSGGGSGSRGGGSRRR